MANSDATYPISVLEDAIVIWHVSGKSLPPTLEEIDKIKRQYSKPLYLGGIDWASNTSDNSE